jgi:hypothetical protein
MGAPLAYGSMVVSLVDMARNAGAVYKNAKAQNWTFATIASGADTVADLAPFMARYKLAQAAGEFVPTTFVLEIALQLISIVEDLNGIGNPDTGGAFHDGKLKTNQIADNLDQAVPGEGFRGTAARAYGIQNVDLKQALNSIAEADQIMADVLKEQAFLVDMVRDGLAGGRAILAGALVWLVNYIIINFNYVYTPPGVQFVNRFQYAVATPVLGGVIACIEEQIRRAFLYADRVQVAINKYHGAKALAPALASPPPPTSPTPFEASGSTVSGFPHTSGTRSGTPDTSRLAGAGGRVGDERADQRVDYAREPQNPVEPRIDPAASGAASTPAAASVPTLSRPAQMSGQAANVSGGPSRRSSPVPGPAERGVPAEKVEDVEAAAGTEAVDRAPIEVATLGDKQAQEPSPVQRNV